MQQVSLEPSLRPKYSNSSRLDMSPEQTKQQTIDSHSDGCRYCMLQVLLGSKPPKRPQLQMPGCWWERGCLGHHLAPAVPLMP